MSPKCYGVATERRLSGSKIIENSPLVKNAADLKKDGWGDEYQVRKGNDGEIVITSEKYNAYLQKNQ